MSEVESYLSKTGRPITEYNSFDTKDEDNSSTCLHEGPQSNKTARNKLIIALIICFIFMIGEVVGGTFAGSLAIMTDAAHLFTDILSFSIGLIAIYFSAKPATERFSFGLVRIEVVGSFLSVQLTWIVTGVLIYLAIKRIIDGQYEIHGIPMLITSAVALLVNIVLVMVLHDNSGGHGHSHGLGHSHSKNINLRAAFIHALGDLIQSFSVLIAAILLYFKPTWKLADPICTFIFTLLIIGSTLFITKDILLILMQATPKEMPLDQIRQTLKQIKGVSEIENLHLWNLSVDKTVLTAHLMIYHDADFDSVLRDVTLTLKTAFHIQDMTIQLQKCETFDFQL